MTSDILTIGPMTVLAHIGCTEEERAEKQPLTIRLVFQTDMRKAGKQDTLADTIDFDIALGVKAVVEASRFKLLEALAETVAMYCLSQPLVHNVNVSVQKCLPFDTAIHGAVEIYRAREPSTP